MERKAAAPPPTVGGGTHSKRNSNNPHPEDLIANDREQQQQRRYISSKSNNSNNNMEPETKELSQKRTYGPTMKQQLRPGREDNYYPESGDDAKLMDPVAKNDDGGVVGDGHVHKKKKKKRAHDR